MFTHRKRTKEEKEIIERLTRGTGIKVKAITDKKLKGRLRHAERIVREAQEKAAKVCSAMHTVNGHMEACKGVSNKDGTPLLLGTRCPPGKVDDAPHCQRVFKSCNLMVRNLMVCNLMVRNLMVRNGGIRALSASG